MIGRQRAAIAERAAKDLTDGQYVNLGVGIPTLVSNYLPSTIEVMLHSENGVLGVGPALISDLRYAYEDLVNASEAAITLVPGASLFNQAESFAMIRGGHIDVALLGAFEVSAKGDLANWSTNERHDPPAVGGAMDLAMGAKEIWVLMRQTTKNGAPRILEQCTYPVTASRVVKRIITDFAVFRVCDNTLLLEEIVDSISLNGLISITGASFQVSTELRVISTS